MTANGISVCSVLLIIANFQPTAVKKWALPNTNGLTGARATLPHHLSHPFEGYSMIWRQLIWFDDCQWDQFFISFADYCKFSANFHQKMGTTQHQWAGRGQGHTATSLITHILRIFNGLEATDMV
jgi:hypothetical protein